MSKFLVLVIFFLVGCVSLDNSPPKYIYEAWERPNSKHLDIKQDMKSCGYKNTLHANDINNETIYFAEKCMRDKGYVLDTSSYRPNNCYGQNSPYLCNRLWGGQKPQLIGVKPRVN